MRFHPLPFWKEAPFFRLLIPFVAGILFQWHFRLDDIACYLGTAGSCTLLVLFSFKTITGRYKQYWLSGILLNCSFFFLGITATFVRDGTNSHTSRDWNNLDSAILIARLEEPVSEKPKSFKALSSVQVIRAYGSGYVSESRIIIYFQKDSLIDSRLNSVSLEYGSSIVFKKKLQRIKSSGNPGSFDYQRFCAFQNIHYQVYLKTNEYKVLPAKKRNPFKVVVFNLRKTILSILRLYIPGDKESGLAEALLIGYKDDLDKNLVQSYSDSGVVHIIAISGLHVGLIYWLLSCLLRFMSNSRKLRFLKSLLIILALWIFCFLAGGSPSVLRSVVMFTFIVLGQSLSRNISIYNSLAASAFLLLCYNPFWLWDTGFQLSYAAVLSIVIFMKPIYNTLFVENKLLDALWKLNAVTLSAQVLTLPMCLYYFHQFPNFFLITNFIAVPLSSIILVGELLLCAATVLPAVATKLGLSLHWLIWLMNSFIERFDRLPFSVLRNIQVSMTQVVFIYVIIIGLSIWIIKKKGFGLAAVLAGIFLFGIIRCQSLWTTKYQHKLIVYNIPLHQSIDFISGDRYFFVGDRELVAAGFLQNFHLQPSRTSHQVVRADFLPGLSKSEEFYIFNSKRIMIIENPLEQITIENKIDVDILIISKAPDLSISNVHRNFNCRQIVIDASNPFWKISQWKAECSILNIPCHVVSDNGAFVMTLN